MFELVFIETKFMGLFAMLFGASFWLFLDRAAARGRRGSGLFYRRIAWLFVIGAIHGWLFWCFDILRFYALWGLAVAAVSEGVAADGASARACVLRAGASSRGWLPIGLVLPGSDGGAISMRSRSGPSHTARMPRCCA